MAELLQRGQTDYRYTGLFAVQDTLESTELHGIAPEQAQVRAQSLIAGGYRPVAISICALASGQLNSCLVLHRPVVSSEAYRRSAEGKANTAAALLRLGRSDHVWQVFAHQDDAQPRSYAIYQIPRRQVQAGTLLERLDKEQDPAARQALILMLGNYDQSALDSQLHTHASAQLLDLYRRSDQASLRTAAQWTLRTWGHGPAVELMDAELMVDEPTRIAQAGASQRDWYMTTQRHTMVVLQGQRYLMGGPRIDPERQVTESTRWKQLDRRYAIAATETSLGQWREFQENSYDVQLDLVNNEQIAQLARSDDCPILGMTWYEAAAYCNWLSKMEGIPEDQWCYERNSDGLFAEGMQPKQNYLRLTGYRLPTEAEWEFAARGGTTLARFYGQTAQLEDQYAWTLSNSDDMAHPCGSLKPNEFGLFDVLGNAWEWVSESSTAYFLSPLDLGDATVVRGDTNRMMCGGSFNFLSVLRTARRVSLTSPMRDSIRSAFAWLAPCPTRRSSPCGVALDGVDHGLQVPVRAVRADGAAGADDIHPGVQVLHHLPLNLIGAATQQIGGVDVAHHAKRALCLGDNRLRGNRPVEVEAGHLGLPKHRQSRCHIATDVHDRWAGDAASQLLVHGQQLLLVHLRREHLGTRATFTDGQRIDPQLQLSVGAADENLRAGLQEMGDQLWLFDQGHQHTFDAAHGLNHGQRSHHFAQHGHAVPIAPLGQPQRFQVDRDRRSVQQIVRDHSVFGVHPRV